MTTTLGTTAVSSSCPACLPACSLSACPAHQRVVRALLCSPRCTKLCRVQSTYADWSTTKRRVSSGANPKPPELCGVAGGGAGELCGRAINQTSTTSTAQPMTTNHRRSDAPSSRKSLRCSLWAIRSVATRFAWMHSLLACGLAGKLIEIWLFFLCCSP